MLDFQYKARDKNSGRIISGAISADTEMDAGKLLLKQDLYPIELKGKKAAILGVGAATGHIKLKDKVVFTRQMATLIKAGLTIAQSLHSTMDQVSSKALKDVIFRLSKAVEGGTPLSEAIAEYPQHFNAIYVSLIRAGESSGSLDVTMERLANQIEKEAEVVSKVRGALIYPAVVMVVILVVMGFMISSVVPQIAELYKSFNKDLPFITQVIVGMSGVFAKFWFIIVPLLAAMVFATWKYFHTPAGQSFMDRAKLTLPPFNQLFMKMYMARFARTLGSLTASGIPILESMRLVSESVNNTVIQNEVVLMIDEVKSGRSLSEALVKTEYFLPLVGQMVKVGEDSGTMGDMLDRLATFYENEVDQTIKNISTLIEPVLIIFLGFMVMLIIVGILYPVYSLVGGDLSGG